MKIERETLVIQMTDEMKIMAEDFEKKKRMNVDQIPHMELPPQCQNVSPLISAIIWARQFKLKIESNMMGVRQLFKDVEQMQRLEEQAARLMNDIGNYEQKLYGGWK